MILVTDTDGKTPVKVKDISKNADGTMTIVSDEDVSIADIYQNLNIDTAIDVGGCCF